jgi:hypothetical protein
VACKSWVNLKSGVSFAEAEPILKDEEYNYTEEKINGVLLKI